MPVVSSRPFVTNCTLNASTPLFFPKRLAQAQSDFFPHRLHKTAQDKFSEPSNLRLGILSGLVLKLTRNASDQDLA